MPRCRSYMLVALGSILFCATVLVDGHGRLMDPPGRSSMWRFTESNDLIKPYKSIIQPNYQDNELFCGGFAHQQSLGGKCGVCGDPYDGPRENEAGGKYGKGIIVAKYATGAVIPVSVQITSNHKGFFEFRLCPVNDPESRAVKECFDKYLLTFRGIDGDTKWPLLPEDTVESEFVQMLIKLPNDLQCSQCVLQWRYHTGNSWGCDDSSRCCVGCGIQEEFYGCADISIGNEMVSPPPSISSTTTDSKIPTTPRSTETTTTTTEGNPTGGSKCINGEYLPRNCNSYYQCIHSVLKVEHCVEGLLVSDNGPPICDWPFNVSPPCGAM